jgi:hypothetical protein
VLSQLLGARLPPSPPPRPASDLTLQLTTATHDHARSSPPTSLPSSHLIHYIHPPLATQIRQVDGPQTSVITARLGLGPRAGSPASESVPSPSITPRPVARRPLSPLQPRLTLRPPSLRISQGLWTFTITARFGFGPRAGLCTSEGWFAGRQVCVTQRLRAIIRQDQVKAALQKSGWESILCQRERHKGANAVSALLYIGIGWIAL